MRFYVVYVKLCFGGDYLDTIGERIKKARIKSGLTQRELAEQCGLSTGTIQQYELNKRTPKNRDILNTIANVLNVSAIYLDFGIDALNTHNNTMNIKNELAQDFTTMLSTLKETLLENNAANIFSDDPAEDLLYNFWLLNEKGQEKAIEQVELLTQIPSYQAKIETS